MDCIGKGYLASTHPSNQQLSFVHHLVLQKFVVILEEFCMLITSQKHTRVQQKCSNETNIEVSKPQIYDSSMLGKKFQTYSSTKI